MTPARPPPPPPPRAAFARALAAVLAELRAEGRIKPTRREGTG